MMAQWEEMAFADNPKRMDIREKQINDQVARSDMPDMRWEDRIEESCEGTCSMCGWVMSHVWSRGGQVWHFCIRCDTGIR